jgi:hypothetical protein
VSLRASPSKKLRPIWKRSTTDQWLRPVRINRQSRTKQPLKFLQNGRSRALQKQRVTLFRILVASCESLPTWHAQSAIGGIRSLLLLLSIASRATVLRRIMFPVMTSALWHVDPLTFTSLPDVTAANTFIVLV